MTTIERWLPVVGWEGLYEVSDLGRVRSMDRRVATRRGPSVFTRWARGRVLATPVSGNGYQQVSLSNGPALNVHVHALVMSAFVGPRPDGMEVRHLNGDPADNRLSNLMYGTRSENAQDKLAHGTAQRGDRHPLSRLSEEQVKAIRDAVKRGEKSNSLAPIFGVSEGHIRRIGRGSSWRHLGDS